MLTHFKGNRTLKNILVMPYDKDNIQRKVVSDTDTGVAGWSIMKSTQGSQPEPVEKGEGTPKGIFTCI